MAIFRTVGGVPTTTASKRPRRNERRKAREQKRWPSKVRTANLSRGKIGPKAKAPVCDDTYGQAVLHPHRRAGFCFARILGLVRSRQSCMVMAGWATSQDWPHGLSHVINIPPTLCV